MKTEQKGKLVEESFPEIPDDMAKGPPTQYPITGSEAEDIRSANRALNTLRMSLSEVTILKAQLKTQIANMDAKEVDILADFTKKSAELQKNVEGAFARFKLDLKDGWKFDTEACIFFKD